jgi:protein-S-isoprenylcysteine O-methyltransferase Ste14
MVENEMDHADVKIAPPVLTLIHIIAAFVLDWLIPLPAAMPRAVTWLGIFLVILGLMLAFSAVRQFINTHTTLDPHGSVTALVTDGPYRFSRNPIYLGFICTLIGIPLAFGTYWGILLSPLLILLMNQLVIRYEETYLERKFGNAYTSYKSRVRRWL